MAGDEPPTAASVHKQYAAQEEVYRNAASACEQLVADTLKQNGIAFTLIESRHKRPLELFKKQRRKKYADPFAECPDLVGVRVVVPTTSDKQLVSDALASLGGVAWIDIEDQAAGARPDQLAYRGLHIHIAPTGMLNSQGEQIRCEVQIRTTAEHSWAETEHKYVYKKSEGLPLEVQRIFSRLLVLVEIFDEELSRGVALVKANPEFAQMSLVFQLEALFESITGSGGDQEITREAVELVSGSLNTPPGTLGDMVTKFVMDSKSDIEVLLREHGPDSPAFDPDAGWLTSQPELLLFLTLLNDDAFGLSNALAGSDLYSAVEPLALWTGNAAFVRQEG